MGASLRLFYSVSQRRTLPLCAFGASIHDSSTSVGSDLFKRKSRVRIMVISFEELAGADRKLAREEDDVEWDKGAGVI